MSAAAVVARELDRAVRKPNGCLLTVAYKKESGHGVVTFGGTTVLLTRLVLSVRLGRDLKDDEQANHSCHQPSCINPNHLYLGTQPENIKHYRQAGLPTARKLTIDAVREIRRQLEAGKPKSKIAAQFGVTSRAVRFIDLDETWHGVS